MSKYPSGKKRVIEPKNIAGVSHKKTGPDSFLLHALLQASPHYVSGNYLAERLKMSRVGVWSWIDKLRKAGISIEASQNRGYRLAGEPDNLVRPLLDAWFNECKIDYPFYVLDSTDSTNSEAERLLASGEKTPFVVITQKQEAGRGRMGRKWHSPKNGNLYLSIALRPNVELVKLRNFTLWQGVSIGKFLKQYTGIDSIMVKWPNDLVSGTKKMGGMLTEASIDCDQVRSLVFGIGLNINSSSSNFPKDIRDHSTSLKDLSGMSWRIHEIASKIIKICIESSEECLSGKADEKLLKEWMHMDFLKGRKVTVQNGKETYMGKADGIDITGGLIIKLRNGRRRIAHAGEVTLAR